VKFILTDHLVSIEPGKKIVVAKNVSMAEEYLADHFPGFPVLPGVMMLEAAVQACAWLVRQHNHFAQSIIVLREARGIKYSTFVAPGQTLVITAEASSIEDDSSDFRVKGTVRGSTAIAGRLELSHLNLHGRHKTLAATDKSIASTYKQQWAQLQERASSA
jgi:3-hydroxyacyl-[acyl-carrier-protein] dehydratase